MQKIISTTFIAISLFSLISAPSFADTEVTNMTCDKDHNNCVVNSDTKYSGHFNDVNGSEIYAKGIEFLAGKGVINGNPDGSFAPTKTLNRAEMVKIVAEAAYKTFKDRFTHYGTGNADAQFNFDDYKGQSCFADVPPDAWFTKYVCYAKHEGWVKGYEGNTFHPTQDVTVVEGLKISLIAFGWWVHEDSDPWYKDSVNIAAGQLYIPPSINGFNNGLKRDEMSEMISRMIINTTDYVTNGTALKDYLGDWANVKPTYDTIAAGQDLSLVNGTNFEKINYIAANNELICTMAQSKDQSSSAFDQAVNSVYSKYGFNTDGEATIKAIKDKYIDDADVNYAIAASVEKCASKEDLQSLADARAKARDTASIASLQKIQKVLIVANLNGKPYPTTSGPITDALSYAGYGGTNTWAELKSSDGFNGPLPTAPQHGKNFYFVSAPTNYAFGLFSLVEVAKNANAVCTTGNNPTITMGAPSGTYDPKTWCYAILTQ